MWELAIEKDFDPTSIQEWMKKNWAISVWVSLGYLIFLMCSQKYMVKRSAINLEKPLVAWNGLLTLFSMLGTAKTSSEFFHSVTQLGFGGSICVVGDFYRGVSGFWMWLFTLSKVVELGDTVFLVLRKRPVVFLHYYHHVATLVYAWYSYTFQYGSCRWGMWMNYAVHSLMYGYYWLRSLKVRLPKYANICVTLAQICQMLVGSYVCFRVFGHVALKFLPVMDGCQCDPIVSIVNTVMYISYAILFIQLFFKSYCRGKKIAKNE